MKGMKMLDFSIHRRILGLYERMTRRYRQDACLVKEFLHYLLSTRSLGKFNRVMARSLHIHPNVIDFWLIAVYCEFDMRGSMQASRNILLQGIRRNPDVPEFYFEYLKFELKLYTRKKLLETKQDVEVIDELQPKAEEEKINGSVPSLIYASSSKSITKLFRLNVDLHLRIKNLVQEYSKIIDTTQLMKEIEEHIDGVLYIERKADMMRHLLSNAEDIDQIQDKVSCFIQKTLPDLESFEVLLNTLKKFEAKPKSKFDAAYEYYLEF
eukprot:CAMPEP_0168347674 /NCGR_PEP_ID=MMETSP0213-20121227/19173_1 /TAXON_ID=151035 /ORGANISM="Euplotes harpa, Strain FSP1.4" /LENGTH=266 /DNA_ID=CAMNT_0008356893 /DNA_START=227 /DNA_END=1027 /DNA_ORIENTATION=-